jgi:very-short-patch-repair endonuclease
LARYVPAVNHDLALSLRRRQTEAEGKLWRALRKRRFRGWKFRRQQPLGPFVVDFISFDAKLIVELDGEQHGYEQNTCRDAARTRYLEGQGYRVKRYWNSQLYEDIDCVLDDIGREIRAHFPSETGREG